MIISHPNELRRFLPSHVLVNLDTVKGFLDNSEHDFLAERIGEPLLRRLSEKYAFITAHNEVYASGADINDWTNESVWAQLITLCQRCVVFDAFARAADIHAISLNDAGINIAESQGYDAAGEKLVERYKQQMIRESHAATNRLLIQLENWQKSIAPDTTDNADSDVELQEDESVDTDVDEATSDDMDSEEFQEGDDESCEHRCRCADKRMKDIREIISLWKQSAYYYYADGLLFNTATEFGLYVNIYDSREKFIQILPDIRYCQETHIESEIGTELLLDLIEKHKSGSLGKEEDIAYHKLQRVLSLEVEARSKVVYRKEAKDESIGHTRLAMEYIRRNQTKFDYEAMKSSPLFDCILWKKEVVADENIDCKDPHALKEPPFIPARPKRGKYLVEGMHRAKCDYDPRDPRFHRPCDGHSDGMLVSSLI